MHPGCISEDVPQSQRTRVRNSGPKLRRQRISARGHQPFESDTTILGHPAAAFTDFERFGRRGVVTGHSSGVHAAEVLDSFSASSAMPMELAMKNRPGEHARQELRLAWRHAAAKNSSILFVGLLVGVAVVAFLFLLPMPLWMRTFELGIFVTAMLGATAWTLHLTTGTHSRYLGKIGEELTAEAVLNRRRRWKGWRLVNGLYFRGHGDVDHVLVGPGGIFALESKWTSVPWLVDREGIVGPEERDPLLQARDGAHKIEGLLRYGPERFDVVVHPVVVLWGPGAPSLTQGWAEVDGVFVAEGRCRRKWLQQLNRSAFERTLVESVTRTLEAQLVRQVERPRVTATPQVRQYDSDASAL